MKGLKLKNSMLTNSKRQWQANTLTIHGLFQGATRSNLRNSLETQLIRRLVLNSRCYLITNLTDHFQLKTRQQVDLNQSNLIWRITMIVLPHKTSKKPLNLLKIRFLKMGPMLAVEEMILTLSAVQLDSMKLSTLSLCQDLIRTQPRSSSEATSSSMNKIRSMTF